MPARENREVNIWLLNAKDCQLLILLGNIIRSKVLVLLHCKFPLLMVPFFIELLYLHLLFVVGLAQTSNSFKLFFDVLALSLKFAGRSIE